MLARFDEVSNYLFGSSISWIWLVKKNRICMLLFSLKNNLHECHTKNSKEKCKAHLYSVINNIITPRIITHTKIKNTKIQIRSSKTMSLVVNRTMLVYEKNRIGFHFLKKIYSLLKDKILYGIILIIKTFSLKNSRAYEFQVTKMQLVN